MIKILMVLGSQLVIQRPQNRVFKLTFQISVHDSGICQS